MVKGTDSSVTLGDLAAREALRVDANFSSGAPSFPFGAHVAVVEVDVESGKAVVDRIITVDDAGPILNPLLAEGQRHGGIAQGIAQALLEEVVYDEDGNPLTATFADYGIPSAAELPSFDAARHGHAHPPSTRWGSRASARRAPSAPTPAVQNAVIDALRTSGCATSTCR